MTREHRLTGAYHRVVARIAKLSIRGQLGPVHETELARLTGARR